jgi:Flp pilus assembly pilin Flp
MARGRRRPLASGVTHSDHETRRRAVKGIIASFWRAESGQDMAEYALLLALIALVLIVAVIAFRDAIQTKFQQATSEMNAAGGS